MYRKNQNSWVKHLDFMILDVICLQVSFFLAYAIRHKSTEMFSNLIYANLAIVLFFVDIVMLFALETLKNVLKRNTRQELTAAVRHVCLVVMIAVLYLFSVKDAGDFSRITLFLMAFLYFADSFIVRCFWKQHILRKLKLGQQKSLLIITDLEQLERVEYDISRRSYDMFSVTGIAVVDLDDKEENVPGRNLGAAPGADRGPDTWNPGCCRP